MQLEQFQNFYIFAKDISGAQQVLAFINRFPEKNHFFLLNGLAKEYIQNSKLHVDIFKPSDLNGLDPKLDCILIGTSSDTSQYMKALLQAKKQGIFTAAIMEHYCNYSERFNNIKKAYPDLILTTDMHALKIAEKVFDESVVELIPDYFFLDQKKEFDAIKISKNLHPTYFTQNIQNFHFNDIDGVELFLKKKKKCDELTGSKSDTLVIRCHPTESPEKYYKLLTKFDDVHIKIDKNDSFITTLRETSYVIGLDTNPMFIGLKLGMPVFCSSPDDQWRMSADLDGILYLNKI